MRHALDYVLRHDALRSPVTSFLRAYVRHSPILAGKERLWSQIVEPYFAWHPHDYVARTRFGSRMAGNTHELLQQYVYFFGIWEPQLTRWISSRLRNGDTFVDVGANVGHFSLLGSKLVGKTGRVVAVEASPPTFRALEQNLALNDARNVRALNMAASSERSRVTIYTGPEWHVGLGTTVAPLAAERSCDVKHEVDAAPLDDMLSDAEIKAARLVKIDVEGMEWSVVEGMSRLLEKGRRDLEVTVEVDPASLSLQAQSAEGLIREFEQRGFHAYSIENDYTSASYLHPSDDWRPLRVQGSIASTTDMVFSRTDAATL